MNRKLVLILAICIVACLGIFGIGSYASKIYIVVVKNNNNGVVNIESNNNTVNGEKTTSISNQNSESSNANNYKVEDEASLSPSTGSVSAKDIIGLAASILAFVTSLLTFINKFILRKRK